MSSNNPVARMRKDGMYEIVLERGGPVPKMLSGAYTKLSIAENAISVYTKERDAKKPSPSKTLRKQKNGENETVQPVG